MHTLPVSVVWSRGSKLFWTFALEAIYELAERPLPYFTFSLVYH